MELNEVKKTLYKESPNAYFQYATVDGLLYQTVLMEEQHPCVWDQKTTREMKVVLFLVPLAELGEVRWGQKMEAKLLIRYII